MIRSPERKRACIGAQSAGRGTREAQRSEPLSEAHAQRGRVARIPLPALGLDRPRVRFRILDGTRPEAPEAGYWQRVVEALPHDVAIGQVREAPEMLGELSAELARRQQEGQDGLPPIYLLIYNLGRFRDLRKEDDFSFGREDDKPATPGKMFATILRDGPACGIHTIAWCDSYATVNRLLDRQGLRDFDLRVLFQMNATDSSSLMDSPDAARRACIGPSSTTAVTARWRSSGPMGCLPRMACRGAAAVVPPGVGPFCRNGPLCVDLVEAENSSAGSYV